MSFSSTAKIGAKVLGLGLYACACYFGANAIMSHKTGEKPQIENVWNKVKDEYNTYKEIKKEGIEASSYAEAKQKLDSIHNFRLYKQYGIVPPAEGDSPSEALEKQLLLQIKLIEDNNSQLEQIIETLNEYETNSDLKFQELIDLAV